MSEEYAVKAQPRFIVGVAAGLLVCVVCCFVLGAITFISGFQLGFLAIGLAFLVASAIRIAGRGTSPLFGVAGAVITIFGCLLGNVLGALIAASQNENVTLSGIASTILDRPVLIVEILGASFNVYDVVFYAIAIFVGYFFSIRRPVDTGT